MNKILKFEYENENNYMYASELKDNLIIDLGITSKTYQDYYDDICRFSDSNDRPLCISQKFKDNSYQIVSFKEYVKRFLDNGGFKPTNTDGWIKSVDGMDVKSLNPNLVNPINEIQKRQQYLNDNPTAMRTAVESIQEAMNQGNSESDFLTSENPLTQPIAAEIKNKKNRIILSKTVSVFKYVLKHARIFIFWVLVAIAGTICTSHIHDIRLFILRLFVTQENNKSMRLYFPSKN